MISLIFSHDVAIRRKTVTVRFARRTDVMPPVPLETKHHPSAVDLLLIKRLVAETSKQNLLQFLQHEFVNIRKSYAERLIGESSNLKPCMAISCLSSISWLLVKNICYWRFMNYVQMKHHAMIISFYCMLLWFPFSWWHQAELGAWITDVMRNSNILSISFG